MGKFTPPSILRHSRHVSHALQVFTRSFSQKKNLLAVFGGPSSLPDKSLAGSTVAHAILQILTGQHENTDRHGSRLLQVWLPPSSSQDRIEDFFCGFLIAVNSMPRT